MLSKKNSTNKLVGNIVLFVYITLNASIDEVSCKNSYDHLVMNSLID